MSTSDLKNSAKRKQVFKDIKEYAMKEALSFDDSDIYLAIEIFHKQLKKQGVV